MYENLDDVDEVPEQTEAQSEDISRHLDATDVPLAGHGQVEDLRVTDDTGRLLTLRTEDGSSAAFEKARAADTGYITHQVRVRVYDGNREVGKANLTMEVDKGYNQAAESYDHITDNRMRLNDITVAPEYQGRGIGGMMLEHSESLARRAQAREIYGVPEDESARRFFERYQYSFRHNDAGALENYKSYYLK